jgi:hypothetical protein
MKGPTMAGHNSIAFESEARRALYFSHINPIWDLEQRLDELKAEKTKLKRIAKAEGFEAYEIDLGLRIRKTEKPETIDNQMARLMAVARYMNQPVGHQFSLLDADRRPDVDRAYEEGLMQALRGESLRNGYDQSLPQWNALNDGYEAGQEQLREASQAKMEAANARAAADEEKRGAAGAAAAAAEVEKRGRGRPKGAKNKPKNGGETQTYAAKLAEKNREIDEGMKAS